MTEMQQRASIEFERQRHLANWLIESSPHMPTPTPAQQKQLQQQLVAAAAATTGGGKKTVAGGGKFKQSPMYLLAKIGHNLQAVGGGLGGGGGGVGTPGTGANGAGQPPNSLVAASSTFNSQTNLPLQILAPGGGGRDGSKPKLRRFNSHDTSANMFSVAEFENARLARRNELENAALLRQRQRYKLNSLSSGGGGGGAGAGGGGDCSTGESKGSKLSNESVTTTEPLIAEQFLERFSLPRVIRLSYTSSPTAAVAAGAVAAAASGNGDHTMTSSSSAESSSTAERPASGAGGLKKSKKSKGGQGMTTTTTAGASGGDLFLLYRYMKGYKSYHVFNTKASTNRKKGYKIPQDFPGYFSFINEKGAASATVYTTIVQLVRDQVYKFLSLENLAAYTESHGPDNFSHKAHYVKATAKAGQVYRLLAVFQDGDHKTASASHKDTTSSLTSERHIGGREKERGKYAQLLDDNRQIYYVSLSAKGKFYEIEQHSAPVLQKAGCGGGAGFGHHHHQQQQNGGGTNNTHNSNNNPLHNRKRQLSRDCVHRIGFIMQSDVSLPLNLRLISPQNGLPSTVPEYVTIAKCSEENFLIACPLDEQQLTSTLTLTKLHLAPQMKFAKCTMGFESEQHMLLNPNVQTVLKFCQFNCDNFLRIVDHETNAIELQQMVAVAAQQQHRDREPVSPSATLTTTTGPSSLGSNTSGGGPGKELSSKGSDVLRAFGRLFGGGSGGGGDRNGSGHEKEDSIIFLSKNDLESLECGARARSDHHHEDHHSHQQNHHYQHHHHHHHSLDDRSFDGSSRQELAHQPHSLPAGGFSEKMKVFTANGTGAGGKAKSSSRWFKGLGGGGKTTSGGHHQGRPISPTTTVDDEWDKRTSLDRYKDMSKLIQERFGTLGLSGVTSQRATSSSDILLGGGGGAEDELVSLNPAPGCGSAEKILSSGYESDSTSCPGGGTIGMQKSRSLQHIGQRDGVVSAGGGKNRPDLVTNISGSVEGGGGDDDDDDRLSELDGDTLFFPLRTAAHQQSFMTQKLYSEFHVKTKQYSKSSSSIQQLLHLASGSGASAHGKAGKQRGAPVAASGKNRSTSNEVILSFEDLRYMNREEEEPSVGKRGGWSGEQEAAAAHRRLKSVSLRVQQEAEDENRKRNGAQVLEDDLPYSSVRDSIVLHEPDVTTVPAESIYAEICNDTPAPAPPPGGNTGRPLVSHHSVTINTGGASVRAIEKRFVSIRINVPPCDSLASGGGPVVSLNPAGGGGAGRSGGSSTSNSSSSRCSSAVSSPIEDNIYNTIK